MVLLLAGGHLCSCGHLEVVPRLAAQVAHLLVWQLT